MAKNPDEFPKTPEQKSPTSIKIPGKTLKHIINSTSFAISRDELKPALTGVLLQIKEDKTVAVQQMDTGLLSKLEMILGLVEQPLILSFLKSSQLFIIAP